MERPIKSPFAIKELEAAMSRDKLMMRIMADLLKIHNKFVQKVEDLDDIIKKKVGPKGERGEPGKSIQGEQGINGRQGPKGETPIKGVDYFTASEIKEIVSSVFSMVKVENGYTPKKGKDYFTESEKKEFITSITKLIEVPKPKNIDIGEIIEKVRGKIKTQDIIGFNEIIEMLRRQIDASKTWRGGGDTVAAGTNITITTDSNGNKVISSSGGGSSINFSDSETPSGTINGVNTSFTLANTPDPALSLILSRNRSIQIQGVDYTLSGNTITTTTAPAGGTILRAWYRYT